MAIVVALVEEEQLPELEEVGQEMKHYGGQQSDKGGVKGGCEPSGYTRKRGLDFLDVLGGIDGFSKTADGHTKSDDCPDESKHGNGPNKAAQQIVTGTDLLFIDSALSV